MISSEWYQYVSFSGYKIKIVIFFKLELKSQLLLYELHEPFQV